MRSTFRLSSCSFHKESIYCLRGKIHRIKFIRAREATNTGTHFSIFLFSLSLSFSRRDERRRSIEFAKGLTSKSVLLKNKTPRICAAPPLPQPPLECLRTWNNPNSRVAYLMICFFPRAERSFSILRFPPPLPRIHPFTRQPRNPLSPSARLSRVRKQTGEDRQVTQEREPYSNARASANWARR